MPGLRRRRSGRVAGLYIGTAPSAAKSAVDALQLTHDGAVGDAHGGRTRPAGVREPAFARGVAIANLRQISIVSLEELADISRRIGLAALQPSWLAANIAIEGAGPITQIPRGTIVRFASGGSIYVTDLNTPCSFAAKVINAHAPASCDPRQFVKAARGRRGLVGMVYAEGAVTVDDEVEWISFQPELPHEDVP